MASLKKRIRRQQQTIGKSRRRVARRNAALRAHARYRARSPLGLAVGFGGGFALGLRREAWRREDARTLLGQVTPLARMALFGYLRGLAAD